MERRQLLKSLGSLAALSLSSTERILGSQMRRTSRGCCITRQEFGYFLGGQEPAHSYISDKVPIIEKSGDSSFDLALALALTRISSVFSVKPGFAYYDDSDGENAFASPEVRMDRSDGTVLFGRQMLHKQLAVEDGDAAVMAICAHEFGHIVQYKKKLMDTLNKGQPTVKRCELHADYLAGYFAAYRKHEKPAFPAVKFAVVAHQIGDFSTAPEHHGTPTERANAISKGFSSFKDDGLGFDDAVSAGVEYVKSL